jgi:thioredoxin-related protein
MPHSFVKLYFFAGLMISGLFSYGVAVAVDLDDDETFVDPALVLPIAEDLEALGSTSRNATVPILLMYSTEDCPFCARLESEVLGPMRLSGADPERVIVRKIMMEQYETLRDFSGKKRDAESYAIGQGVEVVPTVVLVDETGRELVPRIVGYQTPGIYETYLDEAIKVSRMLLEQR